MMQAQRSWLSPDCIFCEQFYIVKSHPHAFVGKQVRVALMPEPVRVWQSLRIRNHFSGTSQNSF